MASENNSAYEKGPLPTFTVVDSVDKKSSNKLRSCCICIPERTGVVAILSFYFLSGFLSSIGSFIYVTDSSDTLEGVFFAISGVLYLFLFVSGILGLNFVRKDNAVMMYKLSIASWFLTASFLIYNLTSYILEIAFKDSIIQECQNDIDQEYVDCNQAVNVVLVKDALKLIFTEFFSFYFSYVISRFSKRMLDSKKSVLPFAADQNGQVTLYPVYVTRPPTSLDWVPPPTYTVRANNVSSETRNAS